MTIEVRCENVSGFDAAVGTYQKCDQKIRVPEKYAGKSIKCPKCSQSVSVPDLVISPTTNAAKRNIMEMDFEQDSGVSSASFSSNSKRCPKCGGQFSHEGICTLCNFVEPVQKAQRDRQEQKSVRPAGFQLWLMSLSNDPKNTVLVGYCFFGAFNLFAIIALAFGIISANVAGITLAVLAAFFLVLIWSAFLKTRQLALNPEASLGLFAPCWDLLLYFARQMKWENYDGRLKGRLITDLRNQNVNDETWPAATSFKDAQVIDVQGCNISDSGLRHLYGHHHLRCLVLKETKVTPTGVANLQQALPRVWIWH